MTAVAKRDDAMPTTAAPNETTAIISMIERAARDPAVDIDKMERLMRMHSDMLAQQAKRAYATAFAKMQNELPIIAEKGQINIGDDKAGKPRKPQTYARWDDINEAIKPVLSVNGFALAFKVEQPEGRIIVTAILSHCDGHTETTPVSLPLDTSGSKNNVQGYGSSISYGKRYAAAAILNLTSRGDDDDGNAAGMAEKISESQLQSLIDLADEVGADKRKFCAYMGKAWGMAVAAMADIPAAKFDAAVAALEAKRAK